MKKLFIHIGPHKTGSTYIQKSLYDNRKILRDNGLYYPEGLIGPQWGHHKLAQATAKKDKEVVQSFISDLGENSLISSENFENLKKDEVRWFIDHLEGFSIEVLYFKRDYQSLLVSSWQESVKHGGAETWERFYLRHLTRPYISPVLNGVSVLDRWSSNDSIRIHVINYNKVVNSGGDVCASLLEKIPLSFGGIKLGDKSVNRSFDYSDIELVRALNLRARNEGCLRGHNVRDSYLNLKGISESIRFLLHSIRGRMILFDLAGSWAVHAMERHFFSNYPFEGEEELREVNSEKLLPSSDVWLDVEMVSLLEKVFQDIKVKLEN